MRGVLTTMRVPRHISLEWRSEGLVWISRSSRSILGTVVELFKRRGSVAVSFIWSQGTRIYIYNIIKLYLYLISIYTVYTVYTPWRGVFRVSSFPHMMHMWTPILASKFLCNNQWHWLWNQEAPVQLLFICSDTLRAERNHHQIHFYLWMPLSILPTSYFSLVLRIKRTIYYRKLLEFLGKNNVFRLSLDIITPLVIQGDGPCRLERTRLWRREVVERNIKFGAMAGAALLWGVRKLPHGSVPKG